MKHKLVFVILLCLLVENAFTQEGKVWLKNGSILYGSLQRLDADHVQLLVDENLVSFPLHKVRAVVLKKRKQLDELGAIDQSVYKSVGRTHQRGLEKGMQIGVLHGRENSEASTRETISVTLLANYRFNQFVQPGISVGYDHHDEFAIFPILMTYRANLTGRWSTPFIYAGLGYGFAELLEKEDADTSVNNIDGGLNTQLGLGYRWRNEKIGFEFAVGWKHQKVDLDYKNFESFWTQSENNITLHRSINRAEFKLGIIF
ncbi:MAG: hypothetical protein AAF519_16130 [Bacteroidota bacterium]